MIGGKHIFGSKYLAVDPGNDNIRFAFIFRVIFGAVFGVIFGLPIMLPAHVISGTILLDGAKMQKPRLLRTVA